MSAHVRLTIEERQLADYVLRMKALYPLRGAADRVVDAPTPPRAPWAPKKDVPS